MEGIECLSAKNIDELIVGKITGLFEFEQIFKDIKRVDSIQECRSGIMKVFGSMEDDQIMKFVEYCREKYCK